MQTVRDNIRIRFHDRFVAREYAFGIHFLFAMIGLDIFRDSNNIIIDTFNDKSCCPEVANSRKKMEQSNSLLFDISDNFPRAGCTPQRAINKTRSGI